MPSPQLLRGGMPNLPRKTRQNLQTGSRGDINCEGSCGTLVTFRDEEDYDGNLRRGEGKGESPKDWQQRMPEIGRGAGHPSKSSRGDQRGAHSRRPSSEKRTGKGAKSPFTVTTVLQFRKNQDWKETQAKPREGGSAGTASKGNVGGGRPTCQG